MYGFELKTVAGWDKYAVGHQGPSNTFVTEAEAEAQLGALARELEVDVAQLRVVYNEEWAQ